MVAFKGVNATLQDAGGVSTIIQGLVDGRLKCCLDTYTILGTEVVADTIDIGANMPKGAHAVALILQVSAAQTSATIDIGDDEDADRYAAADTSLQSVGTYVFSLKNYNVDLTTASTPDNRIVLTTGGATLTAGTLQAAVIYSMD